MTNEELIQAEAEKYCKRYKAGQDRSFVDFTAGANFASTLYEQDIKELGEANELIMLDNNELTALIVRIEEALREIEEAKGAYSCDRLTHMINIVENMKDIANKALTENL